MLKSAAFEVAGVGADGWTLGFGLVVEAGRWDWRIGSTCDALWLSPGSSRSVTRRQPQEHGEKCPNRLHSVTLELLENTERWGSGEDRHHKNGMN